MLRTVWAALLIAVRMASSTLVWLLPTISLSRYTWSLTVALLVLPRRRWRRYDRSLARTTSVRRESRRGDSNPEPLDYKSSALPIAPRRRTCGTSPAPRIGTALAASYALLTRIPSHRLTSATTQAG